MRSKSIVALSLFVGGAVAAADPAAKPAPPLAPVAAPTGPRITAIAKVETHTCDGDGPQIPCPVGTVYLGQLLQLSFNHDLADAPVACADAKPGAITFDMMYQYTGTGMDLTPPKVWPACAADFAKKVSDQWLAWHKVLYTIDPRVDIRVHYRVTLTIKK